MVCQGFKGQFAEIDQKFFDPEIVLQNKKHEDISLKTLVKNLDAHTRHRDGYEHELHHHVIDSVSFVTGEEPIQMLAKNYELLLDADIENDFRFKPVLERLLGEGIEFNGRVLKTVEDYKQVQHIIKKTTD